MKIKVKSYEKLASLVIQKGFNKSQLATAIDLSSTMTNQVCNGKRNPSPKTAKKISEVLETDWDELFMVVNQNEVMET